MKLNRKLIKYEARNLASNIFALGYSLVMPLGLALLFALISKNPSPELNTRLLIMFSSMIPLATMFGHAGNYANELESGSVQRFKLFGYSERTLLSAKLITNLIFITISFILYFAVLFIGLEIQPPTAAAFITLIIFLYLFSAIMFILIHAITTLCGSFSTTYGVTLILLCIFMVFGGMMGFDVGSIGAGLPIYHLNTKFIVFWQGGGFNFLPLILTTVGLGIISMCLMALSVWVTKKRLSGKRRKSWLQIIFKIILPFGASK